MIRGERSPAVPHAWSRAGARPTPAGAEIGTGFRLHKLEVFNWGTFDGHVYSVSPQGQTTLLVGQNGSGKSTLVDALLTLLVRPGVRNFNVAAGAKRRERTEATYFEGAFDRNSDATGQDIRIQSLRGQKKHYSVLLAGFHSAESDRFFTVAQVLYWTGQGLEKVYCFAEDERSIAGDFGDLDSRQAVLRTLKQRGFRATKSAGEYERWFQRATGVKSKAMEVFNQTVAVKDIQRLNDFIRQHMLEPHDWNERVDRLLAHFTQLNAAHQSLVRVRQQAELLEPIAAIGAEFRDRAGVLAGAERVLAAVDAFFARRIVELFTPELGQRRRQLSNQRQRKDALAAEITETAERGRRLRNEMEEAGGDRLKQIPLLLETERVAAAAKRHASARYREALGRAGIGENVADERSFADVRDRLDGLRTQLEQLLHDCEQQREANILARGEVQQSLDTHRTELQGLRQRRENLPEWCVSLRDTLCHELNVSAEELPFVAELIAVKPAAREWEASIEKVLHGFALSLLVPDRLYRRVSDHVERTRLAVHGRGRRLVYLRVRPDAAAAASVDAAMNSATHPESLLRKLEFRPDHSLVGWVAAELAARFDYRCCDTLEEFQRCRGLAMTRMRHVKLGTARHEKDDREQVTHARNFVLGWRNRGKQQRLAEEIERLEDDLQQQQHGIDRHNRELQQLRDQLAAVQELQSFGSYSELAHERHEQEIDSLRREQRALESSSDAGRHLRKRLADVETRQKSLQQERDSVVACERELENQIEQAERLLDNARSELRTCERDGPLCNDQQAFAELNAKFPETMVTPHQIFECKDDCRRSQQQQVSVLRRELEPVKDRLLEAMSRFLRAFPEETDLRATSDYLDSFFELQQRILDEDLPRHERRFKERLNEKVAQEVGLFRSTLERERRSIEDKIETLNVSLRRLEYRPGTHMQLQPRPVRDPEIVEFQRKLRECVETERAAGDQDAQRISEMNEARFLRIRDLVERLHDQNNRRWREKVTDVRRWFEFVAEVIDRESLRRVSSYDDSTGQSGGEKAKLAFTILVAAIAYQYDLDPEQPQSDRLQFVIVDEMFSKVDDQHAEYALELFRQFGLQLFIVAPLDAKARVTQPYVGCYLHVNKRDNRSEVFQLTAREFEDAVETFRSGKPR